MYVLALIRDESKIQRVQSTSKPIIYMFTAAGRELANIRVSISGLGLIGSTALPHFIN